MIKEEWYFSFFQKKNVYRNEKVKSVDFASCEIRSVRKPNIYFIIFMHKYDKIKLTIKSDFLKRLSVYVMAPEYDFMEQVNAHLLHHFRFDFWTMSKRKLDVESSISDICDTSDEKQSRFKEKHSLDSDEEDETGQDYEILPEDDIEGSSWSLLISDELLFFSPHLTCLKKCNH